MAKLHQQLKGTASGAMQSTFVAFIGASIVFAAIWFYEEFIA